MTAATVADVATLHRALDHRVHELYLLADAEWPPDPEFDADVRSLHGLMVDVDETCTRLVALIRRHEATQ